MSLTLPSDNESIRLVPGPSMFCGWDAAAIGFLLLLLLATVPAEGVCNGWDLASAVGRMGMW